MHSNEPQRRKATLIATVCPTRFAAPKDKHLKIGKQPHALKQNSPQSRDLIATQDPTAGATSSGAAAARTARRSPFELLLACNAARLCSSST